MGKVDFGEHDHIEPHENTDAEYSNAVSNEVVESRLKNIVTFLSSNSESCCYVVGMGGHPKSTYKELKNVDGLQVVWFGSMLPIAARPLSLIIASHAGLIKIQEPQKLLQVMRVLTQKSMAGVYVFSRRMEQDFVKRVTTAPVVQGIDFDVKDDPSYFFYVIDADNGESRTGMVEIVSYGNRADFFKDLF